MYKIADIPKKARILVKPKGKNIIAYKFGEAGPSHTNQQVTIFKA